MAMGATIGIAVGMLVVGYVIGIVQCKRKALLKMLKAAMDAAKREQLKKELKAKAMGGDDDKPEDDEEERKEEDAAQDVLNEFLSKEINPGLDDNPGVGVNPILLYNIRKSNEELRLQKVYDALIAEENIDEGELAAMTLSARNRLGAQLLEAKGAKLTASVGSVRDKERRWGATVNSTRILYNAGASYTFGAGSMTLDDDDRAALELRNRLTQIDKYLGEQLELDVTKEAHAKKKRTGDGRRVKGALEVANDTKYHRFTPDAEVMAFEERRDYAQRGRRRVAPPLDHGNVSATTVKRGSVSGAARRASMGCSNSADLMQVQQGGDEAA